MCHCFSTNKALSCNHNDIHGGSWYPYCQHWRIWSISYKSLFWKHWSPQNQKLPTEIHLFAWARGKLPNQTMPYRFTGVQIQCRWKPKCEQWLIQVFDAVIQVVDVCKSIMSANFKQRPREGESVITSHCQPFSFVCTLSWHDIYSLQRRIK